MKKLYCVLLAQILLIPVLFGQKNFTPTTIHIQAEFTDAYSAEQKMNTVEVLQKRIDHYISTTIPKKKKKSSARVLIKNGLIDIVINTDPEFYNEFLPTNDIVEKLFITPGNVRVTETYNYVSVRSQLNSINEMAKKNKVLTEHYNTKAYYVDKKTINEYPLFGILKKPSDVETACIGSALAEDTLIISNIFSQAKRVFSGNMKFYWSSYPQIEQLGVTGEDAMYDLVAVKQPSSYQIETSMIQSNKMKLTRSEYFKDAMNIVIPLKKDYKDYWAKMTGANIGRSLAICIDDKVISFPKAVSTVTSGKFEISSPYMKAKDAYMLAAIINGGKMPAEINILAIERK